jgi:hypothetical protein
MVPIKAAASIGLMFLLAACSQESGSTSAVPVSSTAATTGTLTGLVRVYGGAIDPQTRKPANNGSPVTDLPVKVLSGSQTVAEAKSDTAGKFRFSVAPGRYTLACGQERSVVVVAGETVTVDCDVSVP